MFWNGNKVGTHSIIKTQTYSYEFTCGFFLRRQASCLVSTDVSFIRAENLSFAFPPRNKLHVCDCRTAQRLESGIPWRYGGDEAKIFPLVQINLKLIVSFLREDSVCNSLELDCIRTKYIWIDLKQLCRCKKMTDKGRIGKWRRSQLSLKWLIS